MINHKSRSSKIQRAQYKLYLAFQILKNLAKQKLVLNKSKVSERKSNMINLTWGAT